MADMLPVVMILLIVGAVVEELLIVATLLILLWFAIKDNLGADEGGVYQDQEYDEQLNERNVNRTSSIAAGFPHWHETRLYVKSGRLYHNTSYEQWQVHFASFFWFNWISFNCGNSQNYFEAFPKFTNHNLVVTSDVRVKKRK